MRIALFTETYLPSINGVVTHVKTLKEGLEALGHTVLVVTADSRVNNHVIADDVMYCPAVKLKKIYNYDIAPPISKERLDKIKSFAPDIIHIHNEIRSRHFRCTYRKNSQSTACIYAPYNV